MPKLIVPPSPGRPKRDPVDALFTRLWISAIKVKSGLQAPHAIEGRLEPDLLRRGADGVERSRKWHFYDAGERVPQRKDGVIGPLELAEKHYPGTAAYFDAPLKSILRGDVVDIRWVDDALASLTSEVSSLLVAPARSATGWWRTRTFDEECANRLVGIAGFDGLQAACLLMAKAQLIASPELRDLAWRAYIFMQPSVLSLPVVAPLADELFLLIDSTLKRWLYLRPDRRQEVVFFTNSLRSKHGVVDSKVIFEHEALLRLMIHHTDAE